MKAENLSHLNYSDHNCMLIPNTNRIHFVLEHLVNKSVEADGYRDDVAVLRSVVGHLQRQLLHPTHGSHQISTIT